MHPANWNGHMLTTSERRRQRASKGKAERAARKRARHAQRRRLAEARRQAAELDSAFRAMLNKGD